MKTSTYLVERQWRRFILIKLGLWENEYLQWNYNMNPDLVRKYNLDYIKYRHQLYSQILEFVNLIAEVIILLKWIGCFNNYHHFRKYDNLLLLTQSIINLMILAAFWIISGYIFHFLFLYFQLFIATFPYYIAALQIINWLLHFLILIAAFSIIYWNFPNW